MKIGRITISDRASKGVYEDASGPAIEQALSAVLGQNHEFFRTVVPDETEAIAAKLREFSDGAGCGLVVTTGGTGITARDVTPEATRAVLEKELPGFGEILRLRSFDKVPTSILSRATAGTRGKTLIINLPGKPSAVRECLEILRPALLEGLAHLRGDDPHKPHAPETPDAA